MNAKTSIPEFSFSRYGNLIILGAIAFYGIVLGISWYLGFTFLPFVAIGGIVGAAYAYAALKNPYYILLFVAVGSYLGNIIHLIEDGAIPVTIFQVFLVLCFLCIALHKLVRADYEIKVPGIDLELSLFLALIFFSLIYTPNPENGMFYALRLLVLIFAVYLVLNIVTEVKQVTGLMIVLVSIALVMAVISVRDTILNPEASVMAFMEDVNIDSRARGTQSDPNIFATHYFFPLAFVSSIFLSSKSYLYRALAFIALPILTLGLLSTFSRSAWVSTAVMLILVAWYHKEMKIFLWLLLAGIAALIFIPELQYSAMNIFERVLDIFAGASDDSSRIRLLLGAAAMGMFFDSWLMGIGFRGFPEAFPNYFSTQASIGVVEPHNITYTILAELGIIGFFLFVLIYWRIGLTAYENIKNSVSDIERSISVTLFVTFIAFIIFYQFYGGGLFDNNFWILVGLIFALKLNILRSTESNKGAVT